MIEKPISPANVSILMKIYESLSFFGSTDDEACGTSLDRNKVCLIPSVGFATVGVLNSDGDEEKPIHLLLMKL